MDIASSSCMPLDKTSNGKDKALPSGHPSPNRGRVLSLPSASRDSRRLATRQAFLRHQHLAPGAFQLIVPVNFGSLKQDTHEAQ